MWWVSFWPKSNNRWSAFWKKSIQKVEKVVVVIFTIIKVLYNRHREYCKMCSQCPNPRFKWWSDISFWTLNKKKRFIFGNLVTQIFLNGLPTVVVDFVILRRKKISLIGSWISLVLFLVWNKILTQKKRSSVVKVYTRVGAPWGACKGGQKRSKTIKKGSKLNFSVIERPATQG